MTYRQTKISKYNNVKTVYNGYRYMSRLEAKVAMMLDQRLKNGEFVKIDRQFRIKLYVYLPDGKKADLFNYICDFRCQKKDESYLLVEAKGMETETFRVKKRILDLVWLPDHPEYEYEIIR